MCVKRLLIVLLSAAGCGGGGQSGNDAAAPNDAAAGDGSMAGDLATSSGPLVHDFPPQSVMVGGEQLGMCRGWTLGNDAELFVNSVELDQDEGLYRSSWFFVPEGTYDGPDGLWKCSVRAFSPQAALAAGGLLAVQSVGVAHDLEQFAAGVAIRVPPRARVIGTVQLLNTTAMDISGHAKLTIRTINAAQVVTRLQPFALHYYGLNIPPHASSRFSGDCDVAAALGAPLDARVHYLLPGTSLLGTRVFTRYLGGPMNDQPLSDVAGPIPGTPRGVVLDPPLPLAGATGLRFGCEYMSLRDVNVKWGFGDQETCDVIGFSDGKFLFDATVSRADPAGADGNVTLFTGPCAVVTTPR